MNILLIQAKQKANDRFLIHPPYGLLYLASILRNHHNIKIYDANISPLPDFEQYNLKIDEIISHFKPDIIGIGGMVSSFKFVKTISTHIRAQFPELPLIGGGLVISALPEVVMKNTSLDIGVIGESEEIALELFEGVVQNKSLSHISGLVFKDENGEMVFTKGNLIHGRRKRQRADLDWIPLPSYDLIDLKKYFPHQTFAGNKLKEYFLRSNLDTKKLDGITPYAMPIFAGRGCPFNCVFCFSTLDKHPIKHSVEYVIDHLQFLEKNYGVNHFQFLDENFNFHRDWVIEFCKKTIAEGNKHYFTTSNRNRAGYFDIEMLEIMRKANFYDISVGIESLDDKILHEMNRETNSKELIDTLELIKRSGIELDNIRCLAGFPSDSKESIFNTIKKGNILGYKTLFTMVIPLPGTRIYKLCLERGIIADELKYLEEIYDTDGYRNMTTFQSLAEVQMIISKANRFSEIDYRFKHKKYYEGAKYLWEYFMIFVFSPITKILIINCIALLKKTGIGKYRNLFHFTKR